MRTLPLVAITLAAFATIPAGAQASGDAAAGQRVFNQCRACHSVDANGRNGVGPNLHGIVGRHAGSVANFRYSADMKEYGEKGTVWNEENLRPWLQNPRGVLPRTSMAFPGIRNDKQLEDLIAYLKSQS
jgi:cytochrome c